LAALVITLSAYSRTGLPVARELEAAGVSVQKLTVDLGAALRTYSRALPPGLRPESAPAAGTGGAVENPATDDFLACRHFFAVSPSRRGCSGCMGVSKPQGHRFEFRKHRVFDLAAAMTA
jgi:hypothetical protein